MRQSSTARQSVVDRLLRAARRLPAALEHSLPDFAVAALAAEQRSAS